MEVALNGLTRRAALGTMLALPAAAGVRGAAAADGRAGLAALAIGIDGYTRMRPLERASADARAVSHRLRSFGYHVELSENGNRSGLEAAVSSFLERLDPRTAAFLFFAGHGVQIGGENYLLPTDCDPDSVAETAIAMSELMDRIAKRRPRQTIFVLDACRNGPPVTRAPAAKRGFASVLAPNDFYVVYSAGSGQTALDGLGPSDPDPNGVFTRHFVRYLSPLVPFEQVVRRTLVQVALTARTVRHDQIVSTYVQTRDTVWLDGKSRPVPEATAGPRSELGFVPSAAALIVASDSCESRLSILANPAGDAARLAQRLSALGVDVRVLDEPSPDELMAETARLAESDAETRIFFYAGHGAAEAGDATLLLSGAAQPGTGGWNEMGIHPVKLGSLHALLGARRAAAGTGAGAPTRGSARRLRTTGQGRVLYLIDTGLSGGMGATDGGGFLSSFMAGERRTAAISRGKGRLPLEEPETAMLFGNTWFGGVLDGDRYGSPFAIALGNALGRPGLTLLDLASLVRIEVEDMTRGRQSPMFQATAGARDHVLVNPVDPRAAPVVRAPVMVRPRRPCAVTPRPDPMR